jgi:hypothetical protein
MGILSEDNYNDIEQDNDEIPDIFLQTEFLNLNNQIKEKIRELLTDNKIELTPKDIKILLEALKESYYFDSSLKQRIHSKEVELERFKWETELGQSVTFNKHWDKWVDEHNTKRDY